MTEPVYATTVVGSLSSFSAAVMKLVGDPAPDNAWTYSCSVSDFSCHSEKTEEATMAADRRETKDAIVRSAAISDVVGGTVQG